MRPSTGLVAAGNKLPKGNLSPALTDPETNLYTGTWEMSLMPTSSKVRNDNIQIALWKDKDTGVIDYTPSSTVTAAEASNSGSTIKPNGTSEVAVGYATVIGITGYV